jgi:hypothetical protein
VLKGEARPPALEAPSPSPPKSAGQHVPCVSPSPVPRGQLWELPALHGDLPSPLSSVLPGNRKQGRGDHPGWG